MRTERPTEGPAGLPADVAAALARAGHHAGPVLGAGMEGVVVGLGPDLVAKAWYARPADDLRRLQGFYEAVEESGLALATPRILDVLDVLGLGVSIERRLHGRTLAEVTPSGDGIGCTAVDGVVAVLAALRGVVATPAMAVLPVLGGEAPFDPDVPFAASLAALVERRVRRFRPVLAARLPDLDRTTAAVGAALRALPDVRPALLHGDLVPANVLVDDAGTPTALLDLGFLSTVGDPRFDAAVAAGVHDMYGPRARDTEAQLDRAVVDALGDEQVVLHLYRAAYALVTSNVYSASGGDGHFAWCVAMLGRPDVRDAVGL